jgi:hypothetical protein
VQILWWQGPKPSPFWPGAARLKSCADYKARILLPSLIWTRLYENSVPELDEVREQCYLNQRTAG